MNDKGCVLGTKTLQLPTNSFGSSTFSITFSHVKCINIMSMAWKQVQTPVNSQQHFWEMIESCLFRFKVPLWETQLVLVESCCLLSRASSRRSFALRFLYWQYSSAIGPRSSFWQTLLKKKIRGGKKMQQKAKLFLNCFQNNLQLP